MRLYVTKMDENAEPLTVAYPGDAGIDLPVLQDQWIPPGEYVDVRTGWAAAIPPGFYGRIVGRSSCFRKKGLMILEGIIDAGFRGELFTAAYNPSHEPKFVAQGEALAQLIVSPIPMNHQISVVDKLPPSERGERGFGSSRR